MTTKNLYLKIRSEVYLKEKDTSLENIRKKTILEISKKYGKRSNIYKYAKNYKY